MTLHPAPFALERLRAELAGRLIVPDDADYDQARQIVPGGFDLHPALIARPAGPADVARIVAIARETGRELAVRGGGHSGAGFGTTDGGIVLDLSAMKSIEIDADARTVWADGGLTAGELTRAFAPHGLAVPFGDTGSVGIGGITLGGGVGYLVRKHGLTIDSLLAADVVTADGELVRADEHSHPDLFWAIRGGGGNFGVVARFHFRLHDVSSVVGGMLLLPATPDAVEGIVAAAGAAPEELSAIVNVLPAPPLPFVPAEHHGKLVVMALIAHVGATDVGLRAIAPFRAVAAPLADMLRPMKYVELYPPEDTSFHPMVVNRTGYAAKIDRAAATAIVEQLAASDAPMRAAQLRVLGGAAARVPAHATAYAFRDRRIMATIASFHDGSAENRAVRAAWATGLLDSLRGADGASYSNFVTDADPAAARAAYPEETWSRLVAVKRRYDPTNVFRRNLNVPPDGAEG